MRIRNRTILAIFTIAAAALSGCRNAESTASIPAVRPFDAERYIGTWYEIARLPHSFERDMTRVTAVYTARKDGGIDVLNSGWRDGEHRTARGRARFRGDSTVGELEVSFFGPFYGQYRIIALAPDYSSAMVTGSSRDYLWILARESTLPPETFRQYKEQAAKLGFDVAALEYPNGRPE